MEKLANGFKLPKFDLDALVSFQKANVEALVQAYIFGMLALIYIAGGMQSHEAADGSSDPVSESSTAPESNDKKGSTT